MMWEYTTRELRAVREGDSLRDVIRLMAASARAELIPVVDGVGRLVGTLSEQDLRRLLPSSSTDPLEVDRFVERTRVRDVMNRAPVTIARQASMRDAIRLVLEHRAVALPVIDGGNLVGIITHHDMLRAFKDQLDATEGLEMDTRPAASVRPDAFSEKLRPLVFVVEPSDSLRRDLSKILEASGVDVEVFEAIDGLAHTSPASAPDLILLSAEGGGALDPLEMLRARFPATAVVITREGTPRREEVRRGKGPIFLPCSPEALIARVRGEIGFNRWTQDLPLSSSLSQRTGTIDIDISVPRQVLVVDRDPLTRQILCHHLRAFGCELAEAADGHEAVSRLALDVYDLVTLEIDLPFRSGFEILEFAHRDPQRAPRVIVISGVRRDEDVVQAFALGALDYIKKPLQPEILEKRFRRLLME